MGKQALLGMPVQQPRDHHFVPQFLLGRWCASNGKLTAYTRHHGHVRASELHPRSTAYERDLYAYVDVPRDKQQVIENEFMSHRIDDPAAVIVEKLLNRGLATLTADERSNFTRFVLSLRARHPDAVALARAEGERTLRFELERDPQEYLDARRTDSPATFVEWVEQNAGALIPNFGMSLLPRVIADDTIGARIFGMPWSTLDFRNSSVDLLIGDRPCLLEGDAVSGEFVIALPLSPRVMFLICSQRSRIEALSSARPSETVKRFNRATVRYASSRVYATGRQHLFLAEKYLNR